MRCSSRFCCLCCAELLMDRRGRQSLGQFQVDVPMYASTQNGCTRRELVASARENWFSTMVTQLFLSFFIGIVNVEQTGVFFLLKFGSFDSRDPTFPFSFLCCFTYGWRGFQGQTSSKSCKRPGLNLAREILKDLMLFVPGSQSLTPVLAQALLEKKKHSARPPAILLSGQGTRPSPSAASAAMPTTATNHR